jgi:hypothetical protein
MTNRSMSVFVACMLLAACALSRPLEFDQRAYLSGVVDRYDREVELAFKSFRSGNYKEAALKFRAALDIQRDEVPSYEVWVPLAAAECMAGNEATGQALRRDASCAIKVELGQLECPLAPPLDEFVAAGGTDECYRTMCGEAYTPYYEQISEEQKARVAVLQSDLELSGYYCDSKQK